MIRFVKEMSSFTCLESQSRIDLRIIAQWFPTCSARRSRGCEKHPPWRQKIDLFITLLRIFCFLLQWVKRKMRVSFKPMYHNINYSHKH